MSAKKTGIDVKILATAATLAACLLSGCASSGRYTVVSNTPGLTLRIDTVTGQVSQLELNKNGNYWKPISESPPARQTFTSQPSSDPFMDALESASDKEQAVLEEQVHESSTYH